MKTISMVAYNRPAYTMAVLDSLLLNDLRGYEMFIQIDPGCAVVAECIFDYIPRIPIKVHLKINPERLGVDYNNKHLFDWVNLAGSDFNLAIEDDTPLAPDAMELVNWYEQNGKNFFCLNLFSFGTVRQTPNELMVCNDMCPWAWAFHRFSFEDYIRPRWMCPTGDGKPCGWDWSLNKCMQDFKLKSLRPVLSRSRNIGLELGAHCTEEFFNRDFPPTLVQSEGGPPKNWKIIPKDRAQQLLERQSGHSFLQYLF